MKAELFLVKCFLPDQYNVKMAAQCSPLAAARLHLILYAVLPLPLFLHILRPHLFFILKPRDQVPIGCHNGVSPGAGVLALLLGGLGT